MTGLRFIQRVFHRINFERRPPSPENDLRLDTITRLLAKLGNPHQNLPIIHIAGTKGKGSTANFVAAIGRELGFRTGLYTSPHFERFTERFQIGGSEVSESRLDQTLERVFSAVDELDAELESEQESGLSPATFFDISTAAAFLLFQESKAELVALEVGMGGRLDSTNVCQPRVSVITTIGLDHMRQLGSTIELIAGEKAAIIKTGGVVVSGQQQPEAQEVIRLRAQQQQANLVEFGKHFTVDSVCLNNGGLAFDFCNPIANETFRKIRLPVYGRHQAVNAAAAIQAVSEFIANPQTIQKGRPGPVESGAPNVPAGGHNGDTSVLGVEPVPRPLEKAVRDGLSQVRLVGRLEQLSQQPVILADMAHNEISIRSMLDSLDEIYPTIPRQAVFACARDKPHVDLLRCLVRRFDRIILTRFTSNPRFRPVEDLEEAVRELLAEEKDAAVTHVVNVSPEPEAALAMAVQQTTKYPVTCICGSIFLVAELRQRALRHELLKSEIQAKEVSGNDLTPSATLGDT